MSLTVPNSNITITQNFTVYNNISSIHKENWTHKINLLNPETIIPNKP